MGLRSERARSRMTARSLSVEDVPAPASAFARRVRTTLSSNATFRPLRSNSIIRGTPRATLSALLLARGPITGNARASALPSGPAAPADRVSELVGPVVFAAPTGRVPDAGSAGY